jgi:hypothetical protein
MGVPWAIFVAFWVLSPVVAMAAEPTEAEMRGVIASEKAEGKPGSVRDSTMALDMATGPNVPPSLARIASQPQQCTGRFVKSDAGWVLTTSDCR